MEQTDILEWVVDNNNGLAPLTPAEIAHIAKGMHNIYLWYTGGNHLGDFLVAVVKNDFSNACLQADDINTKGLRLYALFLANKIPLDYREKDLLG